MLLMPFLERLTYNIAHELSRTADFGRIGRSLALAAMNVAEATNAGLSV
jgi:hypothetical protein